MYQKAYYNLILLGKIAKTILAELWTAGRPKSQLAGKKAELAGQEAEMALQIWMAASWEHKKVILKYSSSVSPIDQLHTTVFWNCRKEQSGVLVAGFCLRVTFLACRLLGARIGEGCCDRCIQLARNLYLRGPQILCISACLEWSPSLRVRLLWTWIQPPSVSRCGS